MAFNHERNKRPEGNKMIDSTNDDVLNLGISDVLLAIGLLTVILCSFVAAGWPNDLAIRFSVGGIGLILASIALKVRTK